MKSFYVSLIFGAKGSVTRNVNLAGVRQPGEYEIDVVVRVLLADKIDFTLIVECKHWAPPVDRPVVQKIVQTRDAVAAHKAAIVSPVGFSKEAIEVAKSNGVAGDRGGDIYYFSVCGTDQLTRIAIADVQGHGVRRPPCCR